MKKNKMSAEEYDRLVQTTQNVLIGRTCVLAKAGWRFGVRLSVYFDKLVIMRSLIDNSERPSSATHVWTQVAQFLIVSVDQEVFSSSLGKAIDGKEFMFLRARPYRMFKSSAGEQ